MLSTIARRQRLEKKGTVQGERWQDHGVPTWPAHAPSPMSLAIQPAAATSHLFGWLINEQFSWGPLNLLLAFFCLLVVAGSNACLELGGAACSITRLELYRLLRKKNMGEKGRQAGEKGGVGAREEERRRNERVLYPRLDTMMMGTLRI